MQATGPHEPCCTFVSCGGSPSSSSAAFSESSWPLHPRSSRLLLPRPRRTARQQRSHLGLCCLDQTCQRWDTMLAYCCVRSMTMLLLLLQQAGEEGGNGSRRSHSAVWCSDPRDCLGGPDRATAVSEKSSSFAFARPCFLSEDWQAGPSLALVNDPALVGVRSGHAVPHELRGPYRRRRCSAFGDGA